MQANDGITRGSGDNGTHQHVTTADQPSDGTMPDQPHCSGEHVVVQGIFGNSKSCGLPVGDIMNDAGNGYTEVEQILDYWMAGLDHVSVSDQTDVKQEFNHEVQNLVCNEPTMLTGASITGLSNQAEYYEKNHQLKCGFAKQQKVKLQGSGLPEDPFVQIKESLIDNEKYFKADCLDLKELPHSTPAENLNLNILGTSHIEQKSREIKCEPLDIKAEDAFWSESVGLSHFDVWRNSLNKGNCQHGSNEPLKPECSDSKQFFISMKQKIHNQKFKYESQGIKLEEGFKPECVGLLSQALGHIKKERQDSNTFALKGEGENIHKLCVKTNLKLESCQMEIDHGFLMKPENGDKQGSTSPGLRNEDIQKHGSEVNIGHLGVRKEDSVLTVNSLKQEIYTDGLSESKFSLASIWASQSFQTRSQIGTTGHACNNGKSFPENVPHCSKTKDLKIDLCLKAKDPIWAFQCSRTKKVMTEATRHFRSPSPSPSQTTHELRNLPVERGLSHKPKLFAVSDLSLQCQSLAIPSDPRQEDPGPIGQKFSSPLNPKNRIAGEPSVKTAAQSSPINHNEVAQKPAEGGKQFNSQDVLANKRIGHLSYLPLNHKKESELAKEVRKLLLCKLCGETVISHLQKELNEKTDLKRKGSSARQQLFKCCLCKSVLKSRARYTVHQIAHFRHLSRVVKCPVCDRVFNSARDLKVHSEVHVQGPPVPCQLCDKVFCSENKLKGHHRRCHAAKTIPCDKCEASFSTRASLYYHRRAKHVGRRPFQCSDCKSKFKQKHHLKVHRRIHTDERPFPCPQCPSNYRLKGQLTAHMVNHLRSGSPNRPVKRTGRKLNGRKQEFSDTETSEDFSATDLESPSPTDSDSSDTEG